MDILNEIINVHNILIATHPTGDDIISVAQAIICLRGIMNNISDVAGNQTAKDPQN